MSGRKSSPQYALFDKSEGNGFFGEETTTFLGWYANEKKVAWNKNRIRITSSQVSFIGEMFL